MELNFFIIVLLIIIFLLLLIIFFKNNNSNNNIYKLQQENLKNRLENEKQLSLFKEQITQKIFENVNFINQNLEKNLQEEHNNTYNLITNLRERLAVIDKSQVKLNDLSYNIDELLKLFTDKKKRGSFGEAQLYQILDNLFANRKNLYAKQKQLSNKFIVDAVIFGPKGLGNISIDSKFPMENYLKLQEQKKDSINYSLVAKNFKSDLKKHIDDIAKKYIILGETSHQAIMFIPSEAIFLEVNQYFPELILYSQKKKIWLTSPNTLVYILTILLTINSYLEKEQNISFILKNIEDVSKALEKFLHQWQKIKKITSNLVEQQDLLDKNMQMINKKINKIND